ncbi:hypothetical protein Q6D67_17145 [Haliea sp. E1-2-M8]|uniref:hypothetical protein n=1 Tax=Haliea sp. E1-2-M8 TaxID=3064706 RepID=UPI0027185ABF|nr:hypothetical protein [Haliea sp. E1-2-M8]MDO8863429.1 hypothetical protein [Haliea sp. E1-2-M8]
MFRPGHPLHLVLGPMLWAGWFVALYASLSVVCSRIPPATSQGAMTWLNGILLLGTVIVALLLATLSYQCWRAASANSSGNGSREFIGRVSAGAYLLTASSTLILGVPVILLPPCI